MLRIHIIFEHGIDLKPFGVAYIRDILPLTHPANAEAFQVTHGTGYSSSADVFIIERTWKPNITLPEAEKLVHQIRKDGARLVYSIDDNLLDLETVPLPARSVVRYFCHAADGILVSTESLKDRLHQFNSHIYVLPNTLDERLFTENGKQLPAGRKTGARKTIGFMGTFTHDADLMMVLQALRKILRRHIDSVLFQLVGGFSSQTVVRSFQGLPLRVIEPNPLDMAYPNFIPWMMKNLSWDVGIAPLENTIFNRCKSDIKFLDYSALGISGIYSRVPTYEGTVRHLETGYLVENTASAWTEALDELLSNNDLRTQLALNAQEYVFSKRTLLHGAIHWREAIFSIIDNK
jgi:glycosyltransferase involved in cell wall biosynthesis